MEDSLRKGFLAQGFNICFNSMGQKTFFYWAVAFFISVAGPASAQDSVKKITVKVIAAPKPVSISIDSALNQPVSASSKPEKKEKKKIQKAEQKSERAVRASIAQEPENQVLPIQKPAKQEPAEVQIQSRSQPPATTDLTKSESLVTTTNTSKVQLYWIASVVLISLISFALLFGRKPSR
ncbi:hypothetical protein [Pedobacter sp. SYSU D00535]|uniref:hypothetical protein n=1 Tax=Pedobacter sp. SYSU D00535 TaxID=2810308 RepID=UPI001A9580C0|nr:hypothetical protein [Pedobacter sp. SYSU D00535]